LTGKKAVSVLPENPTSPPATTDGGQGGSSAAIADRIASSISIGLLSVGERLPTEIELAQQFGVAVATLRKALVVLRDRGLVETRRGRSGGTFVVHAPFPAETEARRQIARTSLVELRDLRDEHLSVGAAVAALAAQRTWGESLRRLRDLSQQVVTSTTSAEVASADSRFHIEIAVLSQSSRLLRAELRLQSEINPLLWSVVDTRASSEVVHSEHVDIIDALEAGDAARASEAMISHLENDLRRITEAKLDSVASAQGSLATSRAADAVQAVERWFEKAFARLDGMNDDFRTLLEQGSSRSDDVARIARANRDGLKKRARRYLRDHARADGAGLIFTRSSTGKGRGVIEWWERDATHSVNRYSFGVDPTVDRFYDYEKLEWFTASFESGRHWVTGPYIDYLGVDKYVVTFTAQSSVHGRPVGVAAVDMLLDDFERELLPILNGYAGPAALVSSHGSVLVSSTGEFVTGNLVRELPAGYTSTGIDPSGSSLRLILGPESTR
jgi:GntR family transcriptional repressor for pyruvate dehydrogenase complex